MVYDPEDPEKDVNDGTEQLDLGLVLNANKKIDNYWVTRVLKFGTANFTGLLSSNDPTHLGVRVDRDSVARYVFGSAVGTIIGLNSPVNYVMYDICAAWHVGNPIAEHVGLLRPQLEDIHPGLHSDGELCERWFKLPEPLSRMARLFTDMEIARARKLRRAIALGLLEGGFLGVLGSLHAFGKWELSKSVLPNEQPRKGIDDFVGALVNINK
ncbi:hypothetical protein B0H11DRAFT_1941392 [Mycena galericulata]|nr:hypothetical protein B0H11DRAFT_1941380 [Mycena galericulata]KAJ7431664.1 hypothetical protein B0H11DRAFT_1941392 [Mycena galericulata]